MKIPSLSKFFPIFLVFVGLTLGASASTPPAPQVVPLSDGTFTLTIKATNAFHRDVEALKVQAQADAAKFCESHGKQLKVVSLTGDKPYFGLGYSSAKIVFRGVTPGEVDQQLTAPAPVAMASTGMVTAPAESVAAPKKLTTDEMYNDLTKLDDLRKKGILTDEEFQAEKHKILNRTN